MKSSLILFAFVTSIAIAHPGHDNNSWSAPFFHALWYLPIAIAIIAGAIYFLKKAKK